MDKLTVAVIGAGNVGSSLGTALSRAGYPVIYGVRDIEKYKELEGPNATLASPADAAAAADAVLLTTPWNVAEEALASIGGAAGKVLLDATNPIGPNFALTHGHTDSGGEQVQRWAPAATVVKVFNTTGFKNMAEPVYDGKASVMFYAGDDAAAKAVVHQLVLDVGFDAHDAGPLRIARYLEPFAMVWINQAIVQKEGRDWAFVIHKR